MFKFLKKKPKFQVGDKIAIYKDNPEPWEDKHGVIHTIIGESKTAWQVNGILIKTIKKADENMYTLVSREV